MARYLTLIISLTSLALLRGSPSQAFTYQEKAVAAIMMGEAWCQGKTGMLAVGEVVRERADRLDRTPFKVVTAGRGKYHAFSCLNGTTMDALIRKFSQENDYQVALALARVVCRAPERLPGLTRGATHYCRAELKPSWAKNQQPVVVIGAHAFYRLRWI